jgi:spermidine/putrescine transport system ATP-binding protein
VSASAASGGAAAVAGAAADPLLAWAGVTKRFGPVTAVAGVDLAVGAGEFLTLLGPSGCGKTTLLRLLSGFERPDEGSVWIDGRDVTDWPPYRRDVNQVFQGYALFPHLNVRDNIAFGLRMQRMPPAELAARVDEVMALVALAGLERRRPHELSGGQRQRVALARAIAPRPAVLLLDEPMSALDAKLRQQMQAELKGLQRRLGLTFVLVTHDQGEALALSDRIAVMEGGRIAQLGGAEEIYRSPRTEFVAGFVGEANLLMATLVQREGAFVRLRIAGLPDFALPAARWPGEADRARISIRPERVLLSAQPPLAGIAFAARVAGREFQGAFERVQLELDGGVMIEARVGHPSTLVAAVELGAGVWCGLHPDDVLVLAPPAPGAPSGSSASPIRE